MKLKKFFAAVTAVAVIGGASSICTRSSDNYSLTASAKTDENGNKYTDRTYGDLVYRNYGDHIEILGYDYSAVNVDIPAKIDGLPVTAIGEYAFYHFPEEYDPYENLLVSVNIPDSVTVIGTGAFAGCTKLSSIIVPDSVTVIGKSAFASCYRLTEINIPEGVTIINERSFFDCISLTDVTIPESVKRIGDYAFMGCEDMLSVTIPDSVISIGDSAFWGCDSLTSVTVPKSVKSIEKDAFGSCESLKKVTILNSDCKLDGLATISNFAYYKDEATYGNFYGTIYGYENSTTQAYAQKYSYNFVSLGKAPALKYSLGDVDMDGKVGAVDASLTLKEYANLSANDWPSFRPEQTAAADVNGDGKTDAKDASMILKFYAYLSSGGTVTDMGKWMKTL